MHNRLIALIKRKAALDSLDRLRQALVELPHRYREPLLLQVAHGYSSAQIGRRLGLRLEEVRDLLIHARTVLMRTAAHRGGSG